MILAAHITTKRIAIPLIAAILLCSSLFCEEPIVSAGTNEKTHCFFMPPKNWEIVDAHSLSPKVVIGFLEKSKKGFCPSINLAIEPVNTTLSEYVQAVKNLHEQDRTTRWRDLGKLKTRAGIARLTEIDTKSKWGDVRLLQMLFVKDGSAYVLTAAASKEDFASFYSEIKHSFASFAITSNLLSLVTSQDKKELLEKRIDQLKMRCSSTLIDSHEDAIAIDSSSIITKEWSSFKDYLIEQHNDLGTFWQLQLLQSLREEISSSTLAKDA